MARALYAAANVFRDAAKGKCPESAEAHWLGKKGAKGRILIQPGDLKKKGIRVRRAKGKKTSYPITFEVYTSKKYWYAKFVERGHVITRKQRTRAERKIAKEDWRGGHVSAKPFMRPAWDAQKEKSVDMARDYASRRIDNEVKKIIKAAG